MIKTIKVKKEMNFRELLEYIIQNDVSGKFESVGGKRSFRIKSGGKFLFNGYSYGSGETYEVVAEEEITEDTEFDTLIEILDDEIFDKTASIYRHGTRIRDAKGSKTKKIYALIDGELKLVWERDSDE